MDDQGKGSPGQATQIRALLNGMILLDNLVLIDNGTRKMICRKTLDHYNGKDMKHRKYENTR